MVAKTYADLSSAPDVQDGDLLASYRGTGPLKNLTAAAFRNYVGASFVPNASLASSSGSTLVGYNGRTQASKNGDVVSVKDGPYLATGNGVTNDRVAMQAAVDAMGALANGGTVMVPPGVYVLGSTTLNVPAKATLLLMAGARFSSSAVNAVTLAVGNDGASGSIQGHTNGQSIIDHTGTGAGVYAGGTASQADVKISDIRVLGSSAGAAGIHLDGFNAATLFNVKASGYSTGDGFRSTGANSVNGYNCEFTSNLNGIRNLTKTGPFTSNAIHFWGGQIKSNTGWGWLESADGLAGRNIGNGSHGITYEANGVNGSATTGDIWNDNCDGLSVDCRNYFENGSGLVPTNCITIGSTSGGTGSGANAPKGTTIFGNIFTNTNTNTINDVNGQSVFVKFNVQNGSNTNFMQHGSSARGLELGPDRVASTNYFAGSDAGTDSVIRGGAPVAVNQSGPTTTGMGFVSLSGYGVDLAIQTRAGGSNATIWKNSGGSTIGAMSNAGDMNAVTSFSVNSTKVVGARGAAVADAVAAVGAPTQAEFNALVTQFNALLARVRSTTGHGLIT